MRYLSLAVALCLFLAGGKWRIAFAQAEEPDDWKRNWAVANGFALEIDTEGYQLPTALAFVPEPGAGPKDPLYFVTEVRGKVKVVTNDRTVLTFAKGFLSTPFGAVPPSGPSEYGLAGICLAPAHGYVFVTFAYQGENQLLYNNILRFQSTPGTFSLAPTAQMSFAEIFAAEATGPSHQIGGCQVVDDVLYVGIGDGFNSPIGSQKIDSQAGKLYRLTLDGRPLPDNPFYVDADIHKARNYAWAYGLRNPFSVKALDDRVFVADNGLDADRFLEIEKGVNYLWDGTNQSNAVNADLVMIPSLSPVQMDYYPARSTLFPEEFHERFYVAVASYNPGVLKIPGVYMIHYSLAERRLLSVPRYLVEYQGQTEQSVVGLAFGPDGLYFTPLLPDPAGRSVVLKLTYDPARGHPYPLGIHRTPQQLLYEKGCLGCHSLSSEPKGGVVGPRLDYDQLVPRLEARLNNPAYAESLAVIEQLDQEPQRSRAEARRDVLATQGLDRVRAWIKHRILEPRFDNTTSQMPNMGLTEAEAERLTAFLMTPAADDSGFTLTNVLPETLQYRHLVIASGLGVVLGLGLAAAAWLALRGRPKPRRLSVAEPEPET